MIREIRDEELVMGAVGRKHAMLNELGPDAPGERTPYAAYVRNEELHTLQDLVSDSPAEPAFLVNAQVMELYFGLVVHELRTAQVELRADDLTRTLATLRRAAAHLRALSGMWDSLAWLTPADLLPVLRGLAERHGKDSALQSWMYRRLVFLLGLKTRDDLTPFDATPTRQHQLRAALSEPSLYDDVLAYLVRRGHPVPDEQRDFAEPYVPDAAVVEVWREVYEKPRGDLFALGEALADVAEQFTNWKYRHLMSVRRTFGDRAAYHGEPGVTWLSPTLDELPFPELWTARAAVG
ncbi:tryptophan 2,3-dioxygenase [Amycolatopsis sp. DSM 110486]|uniref:tryptophan 2,3-dioxygenase n=1 Tax=Amycolatopsis sp. DSM 110486 TaxID=2865832 RepID=UPI0021072FA0|nr:tryptophan 2,3-dioxygenase family protein [Amycolatopsis sp. DSM 110486]